MGCVWAGFVLEVGCLLSQLVCLVFLAKSSSRTSPGLLWLLTMFFSFCSISVRVVVCCLLRLCDIFLYFLWFLLKSEKTTISAHLQYLNLIKYAYLIYLGNH